MGFVSAFHCFRAWAPLQIVEAEQYYLEARDCFGGGVEILGFGVFLFEFGA